MSAPGRAQLEAELDALGSAVGAGDISEAALRMNTYDSLLRDYIAATAPNTPVDALRELLGIQDALLLRMRERQNTIGAALRQVRRQDSASRAYATVEIAP